MFMNPKPSPATSTLSLTPSATPEIMENFADLVNYPSDLSDDSDSESGDESSVADDERQSHRLLAVPKLKRRKLDVPYHEQRRLLRNKRKSDELDEFQSAYTDIQKLNKAKKTKFVGGLQGLQARRAHAMESALALVVKNGRHLIDASQRAAETHGFAMAWGSRMLRSWIHHWMKTRELPKSMKGRHVKVFTLLSDPTIAAELRAYLRSNKWAVDPEKLAAFSANKLIPAVADEYLCNITENEMPRGLKKYMEYELFPRIHLKVGRGVSLSTARRWLRREGFGYISHKKGLYFDGHDRDDVVAYRQNIFIPTFKSYEHRLVRHVVGDVGTELVVQPENYVERRLVLEPHDEMISQAHDATAKSWVMGDEHRLRKKGVGRGLHTSGCISALFGWLNEGCKILEYGKNHGGFWTGELLVKQVRLLNFDNEV